VAEIRHEDFVGLRHEERANEVHVGARFPAHGDIGPHAARVRGAGRAPGDLHNERHPLRCETAEYLLQGHVVSLAILKDGLRQRGTIRPETGQVPGPRTGELALVMHPHDRGGMRGAR
jgi:hypothetical protein